MISILANIETNVAEFLPDFPFYLFEFGDECTNFKYIFTGEPCDDFVLFSLLVNIPAGVYVMSIYGQDSSTNEDTANAEPLLTDFAKIYNPENNCYNMPYLLDENNYIITSENDIKIKYK